MITDRRGFCAALSFSRRIPAGRVWWMSALAYLCTFQLRLRSARMEKLTCVEQIRAMGFGSGIALVSKVASWRGCGETPRDSHEDELSRMNNQGL